MLITKGNGEQEVFKQEKLKQSLSRAGATNKTVQQIVDHIGQELVDGMTTSEIYRHAFALLQKEEDEGVAARYSLKRAVMELGPSGFPFEQLVASIYQARGYSAETGVVLNGRCSSHEVDVVAQKGDKLAAVEAKFHNKPGFKTDMKVALYVSARFVDLQEGKFGGRAKDITDAECMLITNTKFTRNATQFARCRNLNFVSWTYPEKGSLRDMIEETGLHPLTCLTSLNKNDKQSLFRAGHVLCRDIKQNSHLLEQSGVDPAKTEKVLNEANILCTPRAERDH